MVKNYYETFSLPADSDLLEIKKRFRDLSLKYHPDVDKTEGAHERFIEIVEAYMILSDEKKREEYNYLYQQYFVEKKESTDHPEYEDDIETWSKEAETKATAWESLDILSFVTDILSNEILGQMSFSILFDVTGKLVKGAGDILGEIISNIDI